MNIIGTPCYGNQPYGQKKGGGLKRGTFIERGLRIRDLGKIKSEPHQVLRVGRGLIGLRKGVNSGYKNGVEKKQDPVKR